ncbi:MAG: DedA family protein, partial [Actinomycetota bacterium]
FFDWLKDYSGSPWFYAVILVIAVLDSVIPVVPSETMVIIGGVSAGLHDLSWPLVVAVGAAGAFTGDLLTYTIGHRASDRLQRRYERTEKGRRRLAWAERQIRNRGGLLLVTARFVPGGRTVLTLTCGITKQPRRWFVRWTAVAAVIWSSYATMLGFIGGRTFQDDHAKAFVVAFVIAISATVLIESARFLLHRRGGARDGAPA